MADDLRCQIEQARARVREAASEGYAAYREAQEGLKALEDRLPKTACVSYVVGDTYPHRRALRRLGLVWDAGHRAWVGVIDPCDVPSGCRAVDRATAALLGMDHEDSIY